MLSLLAIAISAAAQNPDVTLTFRVTGTGTNSVAAKDFFTKVLSEESAKYVESATLSGVYPSGNADDAAFKIGTNNGKGSIKFVLNADYQKEYTKIVILAKRFNAKGSPAVSINGVASQSTLPSSTANYGEMVFEFSNTGYSDITISNGASGGVLIEAVKIYFKDGGSTEPEQPEQPEKQTVAKPEISCVDNVVTISCATEDAAISYAIGEGEFGAYNEPFEITEDCVVKAKATKADMNDSEIAELACKYKQIGSVIVGETEYAAPIEATWTFDGVVNGNTKGSKINTDLRAVVDMSAAGVWHASTDFNCYSGSSNTSAQLGSGDPGAFTNGTITLSGSEIPADAVITKVGMKGIPGNVKMTWKATVNGVDAGKTIDFAAAGTSYGVDKHKTIYIDNLNLVGNEIVLTMASAAGKKAFYLSGINVEYMVPAEPEAPVLQDKPTVVKHGTTLTWKVKHGTIHYHIVAVGEQKSMLRVSDVTDDWTDANAKEFTYTYSKGNNHNVYIKNVVNGKEVEGEPVNINETGGLTGVEAVEAEGAEGVRELYNLQGVRVSEAEAVPGVYVERRGNKVAKIVIK